jgi:SAM-dependent methyltransferase
MKLKSLTLGNLKRKSRIISDRFRGLDFLTVVQPEDVGLDSKNAYRSSPSGDKFLQNLLFDFNISSHDSIIDIGCGKGSAMRTMLKFPFAQVDGLELSEYIANIAIHNFERLKSTRSKIFIADASQFKEYDAYNIVYLYNPFPSNVMLNVIDSLIQSIKRFDRELIIIYNNATCNNVVVNSGIFAKMGVYPDTWGNLISIYSNRSYNNSRLFYNKGMQRFTEQKAIDDTQR